MRNTKMQTLKTLPPVPTAIAIGVTSYSVKVIIPRNELVGMGDRQFSFGTELKTSCMAIMHRCGMNGSFNVEFDITRGFTNIKIIAKGYKTQKPHLYTAVEVSSHPKFYEFKRDVNQRIYDLIDNYKNGYDQTMEYAQ